MMIYAQCCNTGELESPSPKQPDRSLDTFGLMLRTKSIRTKKPATCSQDWYRQETTESLLRTGVQSWGSGCVRLVVLASLPAAPLVLWRDL